MGTGANAQSPGLNIRGWNPFRWGKQERTRLASLYASQPRSVSTIVATVAFVRHIAELSHYQSILVQPELAGFQWMEKCFCMI